MIGLVAGLTGGMLGVGGSIVMIPALTETIGPDQHLYQAAAMIVNFCIVVPAVWQHARAGAVHWKTVRRLLAIATVAIVAGVLISELPAFAGGGERYLRLAFGIFLAGVCLWDLHRLYQRRRAASARAGAAQAPVEATAQPANPASRWPRIAMVALPTGLIAGLLGVGGGAVAVPLQRRLLAIPIRSAIANSAALIIMTSVVGAFLKNWAYWLDHAGSLAPAKLATLLIPSAILGSLIGSRLTHRLPIPLVRGIFQIMLTVVAIRLIGDALGLW